MDNVLPEERNKILRDTYGLIYSGQCRKWYLNRYREACAFTFAENYSVYLVGFCAIAKVESMSAFIINVYARAGLDATFAMLAGYGFKELGGKLLDNGYITTRYVNGFGAQVDLCWNFARCKLIHNGGELTDKEFRKRFARGKQMQEKIDALESRVEYLMKLLPEHLAYMPGGEGAEAAREHFGALAKK